MSDWTANMAMSLEKWGPKTDRRLRMVAIPVNNGDVEDALAEVAAMREALQNIVDETTDETALTIATAALARAAEASPSAPDGGGGERG